jgi:hypothetical protein
MQHTRYAAIITVLAFTLIFTCSQSCSQVAGFPPEQYPTLDRYLETLYPGLVPLGPPMGTPPAMAQRNLSPISRMDLPGIEINSSLLWISDPGGKYYSRLALSLPQGELSRIELIPGASGDLTFHRIDPKNLTSTYRQGRVEAGYRYSLWLLADVQGESELWYSVDGHDSNHIWFYVYSPQSQEYFRYGNVD